MTLGGSANIRIARHHCNIIRADGKNNRFKAKSCTCKGSLASGMTGTYNYYIVILFNHRHDVFLRLIFISYQQISSVININHLSFYGMWHDVSHGI